MKQNINEYQFERAFNECRPNNFSYAGLRALFDYLEQYEEETGEELGGEESLGAEEELSDEEFEL